MKGGSNELVISSEFLATSELAAVDEDNEGKGWKDLIYGKGGQDLDHGNDCNHIYSIKAKPFLTTILSLIPSGTLQICDLLFYCPQESFIIN